MPTRLTFAVLLFAVSAGLSIAAGEYFPPPETEGGWRSLVALNTTTATAQEKAAIRERAGLDWDKLIEAKNYSSSFGTRNSVVVIRHGWIAGEWRNYEQPLGIASCTKSITGLTMAKLFDASDRGVFRKKVSIDDYAWNFMPASWGETEPARKKIQIRHLLTMSSGLTPYDGPYKNIDYQAAVFAQTVEAPPGTVWAYASAPIDMMTYIVEDVSGRKLGDFFNDEIAAPIGCARIVFPEFNDHSGASGGPGGGARFVSRELARVGYLLLHGGAWERNGRHEQIVSRERVAQFTSWAAFLQNATWKQPNFAFEPHANEFYGHTFWTNHTGQSLGREVPRDAFYLSGWGRQSCVVIPSLDMVVVRLGPDEKLNKEPNFYRDFLARIMAAVIDAPKQPAR